MKKIMLLTSQQIKIKNGPFEEFFWVKQGNIISPVLLNNIYILSTITLYKSRLLYPYLRLKIFKYKELLDFV